MIIARQRSFSNPFDAGTMYDQKIQAEERKIEELRKDIKLCQAKLQDKKTSGDSERLKRSIRLDRHNIHLAEERIEKLKKEKKEAKAKQKKAALGLAGVAALTAGSILLRNRI